MSRALWILLPLCADLSALCLADEAPAQRPNILFCISDDQSWMHAGAYGCGWVNTPAFDRVARDGLLFLNAYTPNAKCAPSRACLLTGRNTWQLEAACNHWCYFPPQFRSWFEGLSQHGYHVGYTGKGWAPGIAKDAAGKPRQLTGRRYSRQTLKPPTKAISRNDYAANFADFLQDSGDRPWCFWYGSTEPHRRYEYGTGVSVAGKSIEDIDEVPGFWPDNETVRNDMLDYALEIEHFDTHLGRMLQQLEQSGQLANTLIIVTADNGMPFPRVKGQEYEMSNHLPLAVMWQDRIVEPGRVVEDLVSFIDIAPTAVAAAQLSWDEVEMADTPGRSLLPLFDNTATDAHREFVVFGKERHDIGRPQDQGYPIRGIVDGDYLYLKNYETTRWPAGNPETGYLNCDGSPTKTELLNAHRYGTDTSSRWQLAFGKRPAEELYRIVDDRYCLNNLASNPTFEKVRRSLAAKLQQRLQSQDDPRQRGQNDYFEKLPYADSKGARFYERFQQGEKLNAGWVNSSDFEPVRERDE
ncbi:MAG: sulfatase [Planctomycetaceae bacterium]|nr:sulfatase [Planctomycetaceae bacterium]